MRGGYAYISIVLEQGILAVWEQRVSNMNMEERIARINELYHKSQAEGLSDEEREEQTRLRKEYVANIRANLKGHLDSITIQHPDGTKEKLSGKYGNKE